MTIWMSLDWPLLVGGKPIATVPPYVVFMFELMVLLGSLCTVAGLIILLALQAAPRAWPTIPASPTTGSASSSLRPATDAAKVERMFRRGRLGGGAPCGVRLRRLLAAAAARGTGCDYYYNDVPSPDDLLHSFPGSTP